MSLCEAFGPEDIVNWGAEVTAKVEQAKFLQGLNTFWCMIPIDQAVKSKPMMQRTAICSTPSMLMMSASPLRRVTISLIRM
jgi:hypothetical protein